MRRRRTTSTCLALVCLAFLTLAPEVALGQARQIVGGTLGSAAGFLGGIYAGAAFSGSDGDIYDIAVGAVVGSGIGAATGALIRVGFTVTQGSITGLGAWLGGRR